MNTNTKVFGGYCYFPDHPLADLHGIVRFTIRARQLDVPKELARYGVNLLSIHSCLWGESKSHVEHVTTFRNHGEVYFCHPAKAYLSTENYQHNRQLMSVHRRETERLAHTEGSKVASAPRRGPRSEFP